MKNNGIIVAIVIFVLIIVGMFVFAFLKKSELKTAEETPVTEVTPLPGPYDYIDRVDAKHFFINGEHTLVGEIIMPTKCDLLNPEASVAESMPEQVVVNFNVINTEKDCEKSMTPQRFKVTFKASENATISARIAGRDVTLNLVPAQKGESPDDFELFIKG